MKKRIIIAIRLLALLLILTLPEQLSAKTEKVSKNYSKTYTVKPDARLILENQFGEINLTSWNENRVEILVEVIVEAKTEDKAKKKLSQIDISISGSSSQVKAITKLIKTGGNFNGSFEINMKIKAPASMVLELDNDFGDVVMTEWTGPADIEVEYGSLTANKFTSEQVSINLEFSNGNIGLLNKAELNLEYAGKFNLDKAKELELDAEFSQVDIESVERIMVTTEYGGLEIGQANQVDFDGEFTGFTLGKLYKRGDFKSEYGAIKIRFVSKSFNTISLRNSYSGTKVYFEKGASFDFEITSENGGLSVMDDAHIKIEKEGIDEHYMKGYYGEGEKKGKVTAESEYGEITLKLAN